MTKINELNQKESLNDNDIIPIWDSESSRTRAVVASVIKNSIGNKYVSSASYVGETLTLTMSDSSQVTTIIPDGIETGKSSRDVYLTTTGSDIKQTLVTSDVPQGLILTAHQWETELLGASLADGEFTFLLNGSLMLSASFQLIRETAGGSVTWAAFVETSIDNGVTWIAYPGTARRVTISSSEVNEIRIVDITLAIKGVVGERFRFRHVTNNASKAVSVISKAASGGAPSSAGVIVSSYGIS